MIEHRSALLRVAFSWTHDLTIAEDLAQEALLRGFEHAGAVRDPGRLKAWLFVIMGNCFRDLLRRNKRLSFLDDESLAEECLSHVENDVGAAPADETAELVARVQNAIANLGIGQRQVVTLVDIEGFGYAEVARILDVPIGTVMSRLSRARSRLRTELLDFDNRSIPQLRTVK